MTGNISVIPVVIHQELAGYPLFHLVNNSLSTSIYQDLSLSRQNS